LLVIAGKTHAQVAHIRIKRENRDRARQTSFDERSLAGQNLSRPVQ